MTSALIPNQTILLVDYTQAICDSLMDAVPVLHKVSPYEDQFDVAEIDDVTLDPPEAFVSTFGGPLFQQSKRIVDMNCGGAVTIAAKPLINTDRDKAIKTVQQQVYLAMTNNLWGLDPEYVDKPELISSEGVPGLVRQDGIKFWVITFKQNLRTGSTAPGLGYGV